MKSSDRQRESWRAGEIGGGLEGEGQAVENLFYNPRILDGGDDMDRTATAFTYRNVDVEDPAQKLRPRVILPPGRRVGLGRFRFHGRLWKRLCRRRSVWARAEGHIRCRDDPRTPLGGGTKDPVKRSQVHARGGY